MLSLGLEQVDYRPYLRAPYYTETRTRLQASTTTNVIVRGELSAGVGRAVLTPVLGASKDEPEQGRFRALPLAGYGNRQGHPAEGTHDDLYVKAVALRVGTQLGVMVGADALIIPPEVAEAAARRLLTESGLRREQLYLSATHTHCSVGGWGEGVVAEAFAGGFQPGIRTWFANRIVAAVQMAIADLKPAEFGFGRFTAPEFVRNRVVGDLGKIDPEFSFGMLKQAGGKLVVLGSYAAHATVLSGGMMQFSADYPGCWQRAIERATGGTAVFFAGGVGSHSPAPGTNGFAGAERMGQALAGRVLELIPEVSLTNSIAFGILGLDVSLPPLNVRVSDGIRLRPWVARRLLSVKPQSFLQAFRLGDSIWASTPCDFSGELALGIKNSFRPLGISAVITSFNGDYIGYVIPARYYHLDGYEPRLMSFFGPNVPDCLEDLIRGMMTALARQ
jgi:neutral ceramidase